MNKQEFIERLANPERYEILDWYNKFKEILPQHRVFFDIELKHFETSPGVHVFKVIAPERSATYSFITTIRNKWKEHDTKQLEMVRVEKYEKTNPTDRFEPVNQIHFSLQITEKNHIDT